MWQSRRQLHYILLLDTTTGSSVHVDEDGQERQQKVCVRLQESYCLPCSGLLAENVNASYSGYDSNYEYLGGHDYGCEDDEGDVAIYIAEDYESLQSKRSNKRNQKISNKKESRRIKVTGENSSKNPRSRFTKLALATRVAKRDEQIALGAARRNLLTQPRLTGHSHSLLSSPNEPQPCHRRRHRHHQHQNHDQQHILSAEHLLGAAAGNNGEAMYQRLLEIANGAEITPEDYDLLLLLDEKNVRSTLQASDVEQFELLVIVDTVNADREDDGKQTTGKIENQHALPVAISRQSLGAEGFCLICLQPFAQLENGFELRRLPCQHIFCRFCIEPWLAEFDAKCPDLSCFWNSKTVEALNEETAANYGSSCPVHERFTSDESNKDTAATT